MCKKLDFTEIITILTYIKYSFEWGPLWAEIIDTLKLYLVKVAVINVHIKTRQKKLLGSHPRPHGKNIYQHFLFYFYLLLPREKYDDQTYAWS